MSTVQIPLTKGKFATVDAADFDFINQWKWNCKKCKRTHYACRTSREDGKMRTVWMHRVLLGIDGKHKIFCDHIDNDGLNNTRNNMRTATHQENCRNRRSRRNSSSKYLGVSRYTRDPNTWVAQISTGEKKIMLGHHKSEEAAAKAYDAAALKYHGEFAHLNFERAF